MEQYVVLCENGGRCLVRLWKAALNINHVIAESLESALQATGKHHDSTSESDHAVLLCLVWTRLL